MLKNTFYYLCILLLNLLIGCRSIHFAASEGNLAAVQEYLSDGISINSKTDLTQLTPLHCATQHGNSDVSHYLLENGADVNLQDIHGCIPLHYEALSGDMKIISSLIEKGSDINHQNGTGHTPLWSAIYSSLPLLYKSKYYIQSFPQNNMEKDNMNRLLALHNNNYFVKQTILFVDKETEEEVLTDYKILLMLLDQKANPNICTNNKISPLHLIAYLGFLEIAGFLLDYGAIVDISDQSGHTPLLYAIKTTNRIRIFNDKNTYDMGQSRNMLFWGNMPVSKSALKGNIDMIQLLLDRGADVNAIDHHGNAVLHTAVRWNLPQIVDVLIKNGANPNQKNEAGITPIRIAKQYGFTKVETILNKYK